jgi:undecaprenyl-diphosphatase
MFSMDVTMFDSISVIAWTTLIFAILLYISDQFPQRVITIPTKKQAFFYGLFQCLALIPGVSRSGITMTIGRFLGHDRVNAARYSMLLGMVAILGAGLLTANSLISHTNFTNDFWVILCVGAVASCITAYITIVVMMRWVKKASFTPFVVYRVILAGVLLFLIHNGMIPEKI